MSDETLEQPWDNKDDSLEQRWNTIAVERIAMIQDKPAISAIYKCPVCGYDLTEPPTNYSICPCCGTEFGYDDADASHADLRQEWVAQGCPWFSQSRPAPTDWDARQQIAALADTEGKV